MFAISKVYPLMVDHGYGLTFFFNFFLHLRATLIYLYNTNWYYHPQQTLERTYFPLFGVLSDIIRQMWNLTNLKAPINEFHVNIFTIHRRAGTFVIYKIHLLPNFKFRFHIFFNYHAKVCMRAFIFIPTHMYSCEDILSLVFVTN